MHEGDDHQSRQEQVLSDRTRSSRQSDRMTVSNATGYQEIEQPDRTRTTSVSRRPMNWPFGRIIRDLKRYAGDVESVREENLRLRAEVDEQQIRLQNLQNDMVEASKKISDHERKHAEAQQAHTERINECTREYEREIKLLKEQAYTLEIEKASSRAVANSTKVSDTVILDIWKRMGYNICSLANTLLTRCPAENELALDYRGNNDTALQTTSAEYRLLADEGTRSAVVEYYIWRSIVCCVFGSGQQRDQIGAWSGTAGNKLHALCRILLLKVRCSNGAEFMQWRSEGAAMIERTVGSHDQILLDFVSRENHRLSVLLPPEKRRDDATRNSLQRDLLSIFRDATALHSIFMKSRALFHVDWVNQTLSSNHRVTYDSITMEAEMWGDGQDVKRVLLGISPGLSKTGTADGVGYDQVTLLVKPRVVCD